QIKTLTFITVLMVFSGCAIQQLSYFQVDPYSKPFAKKVSTPINIVLMGDVKDSLVVEGEGIKKMTVTEFRKSFSESMKKTLETNFEVINITDSKPEEGLSLIIYRVRPFWKLNSTSSTGGEYSTTTSFISAAFQFESSLFLNDKKLESADLTVYSDDQMSTVSQAHPVFKSGLIKACETINKEIFKD